jgi:hypothetical protein
LSRPRVGVWSIVAAVVAATALTGAAASGYPGSHKGRARARFTLRGHVAGLYPGASKRLVVAVHNRARRPLRVRSITTHVGNASAGCRRANLRVSAFRGRLLVGPGRTRRVALRARMREASPDACQGAVFPLRFHGRATR